MTSLQTLVGVMAVCLASVTVRAQERRSKPVNDQPIVVKITTLVSGRVVEVENPETKKKEPKTVDRRMEWAIGDAKFTTFEEVLRALARVASDPASMQPNPATGGKRLATMRITPGPNVQWGEVLLVLDAGNAAGFPTIDLEGVGTDYMMPMAIDDPVIDKSDLIVPSCAFCEPDESPPEGRPQVDVHRDGKVAIAGRVVFELQAGKPEKLDAMRAELRKVRVSMEKVAELVARPGSDGKWIEMPVLIRADTEARWRDVHRLLAELTKPEVGFWKLQFAVAEQSSRIR